MCGWQKKNSGYALVTVLMVTGIMFVLTVSLGVITAHTRNNVAGEQHFVRALYAAGAGIEKTLAEIMADPGGFSQLYSGLPAVPYDYYSNKYCDLEDNEFQPVIPETQLENNVIYQVGVAKMNHAGLGRMVLLNAVGKCLDGNGNVLARKTLRAEIVVYSASDYFRGFSIFPQAPVELTSTGNLVIDADLYINGSIELSDSTKVERDVYASGIIRGNGAGIEYPRYAYIPPFPAFDEDYYKSRALAGGQDYYGVCISFENKTDSYSGFYYIDGDIDICGEYSGNAVLFATGNINVTADLIPQNTGLDSLTLICRGNIDVKNSVVYANLMAGGRLEGGKPGTPGNAEIHGAVCVTGIDFDAGNFGIDSRMFYRNDMCPGDTAVQATVKVMDWREKYRIF